MRNRLGRGVFHQGLLRRGFRGRGSLDRRGLRRGRVFDGCIFDGRFRGVFDGRVFDRRLRCVFNGRGFGGRGFGGRLGFRGFETVEGAHGGLLAPLLDRLGFAHHGDAGAVGFGVHAGAAAA